MISWIKGEVIDLWQANQKFFVLINCQGLGYEIQILESFFLNLKNNKLPNKNTTLWIKHIKKEDSDLLFGFSSKDQKDFFIEILNIRGIGSQIGMGILNKLSISEAINAINTENKKLLSTVPGIGQKMTERIILELKSKFKDDLQINGKEKKDPSITKNNETSKLLNDLKLTLHSLNYSKKEINGILPIIINESDVFTKKGINISFEKLLKLAMNYLDMNNSNIDS